jgi:AraC family transcriptional regulator
MFFGDLRWSRALDGITLSHRTANSPAETVAVHTHVEAHFVYVTSGRYISSARGDANPRSILLYNPPGTTHRDHFFHGQGAFFSVSISNSRLAASLETAAPPLAIHLLDNCSQGLAVALLMECARWNASSRLKVESLCLELLARVSNTPRIATKSVPRWLRTACELIQDCPAETREIRYIAKTVGVHPTHLARVFRMFLGCTPGDLLRTRRLELAAAALTHSGRSLAEISLDSGFSDQMQFTKAFRRLYGIPPGIFRNLGRNAGCCVLTRQQR